MKIPDYLLKVKSDRAYENKIPFEVFMGFAMKAAEQAEQFPIAPEDVVVGFWQESDGTWHLDVGHKDTFDKQASKYRHMFSQ